MSVTLVVAEKPSVARDIAHALTDQGAVTFTKETWGFSSPRWWVTSARGHLLSEANPEQYHDKWKQWDLESLPIVPHPVKYVPRDSSCATQLAAISSLMNNTQVSSIVNACDAGREGELIFKLIYEYANCSTTVRRAWFSSMTPETLYKALTNTRPDVEMAGLEAAARCRSRADWLIGLNVTRAATVKLGKGRELLSLGRVQTPTLALVVQRDHAVDSFTSTPFWVVQGTVTFVRPGEQPAVVLATHHTVRDESWTETKFSSRAEADEVSRRVQGRQASLLNDDSVGETSRAPHLFDLTTLQREANTIFGYSAAKTLQLAQACYETHKILTYPRTDSSYLPKDMGTSFPKVLQQCAGHTNVAQQVGNYAQEVLSDPEFPQRLRRVLNDKKVTDHHAIIPTGKELPADLSADEFNLYHLVLRRTLAAVSASATTQKRTLTLTVNDTNDTFRVVGRTQTEAGWKQIYPPTATGMGPKSATREGEGNGEAGSLPDQRLNAGDVGTVTGSDVMERSTQPPKRFTDASLLAVMATAGRLVDDEELAAAMKDSGLGTPATRADLIERLIGVGYVERKGKHLRATRKGVAVIGILGDHTLTSPEVTGKWEHALKKLERAPAADVPTMVGQFTSAIVRLTTNTVDWFRSVDATGFTTADVLGGCPVTDCDGTIIARKSSWSCDSWKSADDPGCGFVIWKKQSGRTLTRAAAVKLLQQSDGTVPSKTPRRELCACPTPGCQGKVLAGDKGFGCSSWAPAKKRGGTPEGCGFVLWRKRRDGTVLDDESALTLIAEGVSDKKPEREKLAPCPRPRCKGHIVETAKAFSCDSWSPKRKGCGTTLWKTNRAGQTLVTKENLAAKLAELV